MKWNVFIGWWSSLLLVTLTLNQKTSSRSHYLSSKAERILHFLHNSMLSIPLLSFAIKSTITLLPIPHLGPLAAIIGTIWLNPVYRQHADVSLQACYYPHSLLSCSLIIVQFSLHYDCVQWTHVFQHVLLYTSLHMLICILCIQNDRIN